MPLAGKGMLLTSMDIDPADEADFNRWYDREHLEERVAIDGFLEARRYVAHTGSPKYLCLYSTTTIDVLDSPGYRAKLANPTDWSRKTMARFKNMIRAVARITSSREQGRGAMLGIVSMHLIESDPKLSGPTAEISAAAGAGASDWFILIDGTSASAISAVLASRFTGTAAPEPALQISSGIYDLMWDLAKSDIRSDVLQR